MPTKITVNFVGVTLQVDKLDILKSDDTINNKTIDNRISLNHILY